MLSGLMRTPRTRLDLDKDGDKFVFRRFGGESDLGKLTHRDHG